MDELYALDLALVRYEKPDTRTRLSEHGEKAVSGLRSLMEKIERGDDLTIRDTFWAREKHGKLLNLQPEVEALITAYQRPSKPSLKVVDTIDYADDPWAGPTPLPLPYAPSDLDLLIEDMQEEYAAASQQMHAAPAQPTWKDLVSQEPDDLDTLLAELRSYNLPEQRPATPAYQPTPADAALEAHFAYAASFEPGDEEPTWPGYASIEVNDDLPDPEEVVDLSEDVLSIEDMVEEDVRIELLARNVMRLRKNRYALLGIHKDDDALYSEALDHVVHHGGMKNQDTIYKAEHAELESYRQLHREVEDALDDLEIHLAPGGTLIGNYMPKLPKEGADAAQYF